MFTKQNNNKHTVVALKEDDNGKIIFWKTHYKTGSKLTNKFKKISLGDYSTKAKNRIETATSQISQPEQDSDSAIKPIFHGRPDNSNIAQTPDSVKQKSIKKSALILTDLPKTEGDTAEMGLDVKYVLFGKIGLVMSLWQNK